MENDPKSEYDEGVLPSNNQEAHEAMATIQQDLDGENDYLFLC